MTKDVVQELERLKVEPWTHYNDGWNKALDRAISIVRDAAEPRARLTAKRCSSTRWVGDTIEQCVLEIGHSDEHAFP